MTIASDVAELLDCPVASTSRTAGGDSDSGACEVELADGRRVFAKRAPGRIGVEAAGLAWLAAGGARVPEIVAADADLLVLSWVDARSSSTDGQAARDFGCSLAVVHRAGADGFGCPPPGVVGNGWIGSAPMTYDDGEDWPSFFAEQRIRPYLQRARSRGNLAVAQYDVIATACDDIRRLAGPPVPPARLHGDLWAGNVLPAPTGWVLIDPAAHGGHPESDLAMLALFPPAHLEKILDGYQSVAPLPTGWRHRIELHQLFPLLVHAELFGGAYGSMAAAAAGRVLRH